METHLFIIWNRAENWRDKIIENINKKLQNKVDQLSKKLPIPGNI